MTRFAVIDPATEETIVEVEEAGIEQADEAVARARAAFRPGGTFLLPDGRGFFVT